MANLWQPAMVLLTAGAAIGLRFVPRLRGYQFTAWIIAAVTAAMIFPNAFQQWGGVNLRDKWIILLVVQAVMFGMGTQMKLEDFMGVLKAPRGVFVGIVCHFSVMPLVGFALTRVFHFEPEIAAGIILIGSCSSGLASNVMAYIAKSNLVLSVTVTAITTMIAPIMTPLWMKWLAGTMVEVKFFNMMMEIIKIVIVPVGAALLHDYLKHASPRGRKVVLGLAAFGTVWIALLLAGGWTFLKANVTGDFLTVLSITGFLLSAFVIGVVYHWLARRFVRLDSWMPVASMAGIVYFTTVTTAAGRDNLMKVGLLLFLASVIHNGLGYACGYWLSRASGLDKNSARSVAFEVGLQNGGMASGLAGAMGKLGNGGPGGSDLQSVDEYQRFGAGKLLAETAGQQPVRIGNEGEFCDLSNPGLRNLEVSDGSELLHKAGGFLGNCDLSPEQRLTIRSYRQNDQLALF